MYALGVAVFGFLAWIFAEAVHVGETDARHSRQLVSILAGALWPVLLVGVAQLLGGWILARLSQSRRRSAPNCENASTR